MANRVIDYELRERLAILKLDDGKANVVSFDFIAQMHEALDRAEQEAQSLLLVGRPGRFSAGFDMNVMGGGPDEMIRLVSDGCKLLSRMLVYPRPIVAACTGHALAAGAMLLLCSDFRVGASGEFKIGLNEVAIGLKTPFFLVELAHFRLSKLHLQRALIQAEIYSPSTAVDAGFLDGVTEPEKLTDLAILHARRLAPLPNTAFAAAKTRANGDVARRMVERLADDVASLRASC